MNENLQLVKKNGSELQTAEEFDRAKIELIKKTIMPKASDLELELFIENCKTAQLNPLLKQIYALPYSVNTGTRDQPKWETKFSTVIGIDGYRVRAARTGEYDSQEGPLWCGTDGNWVEIWINPKVAPFAAKVGIRKRSSPHITWGIATFDQFAAKDKQGQTTGKWATMPSHMIAKCAEAQALRKAFPEAMAGLASFDFSSQPFEECAVKSDADIERENVPLRKLKGGSGDDDMNWGSVADSYHQAQTKPHVEAEVITESVHPSPFIAAPVQSNSAVTAAAPAPSTYPTAEDLPDTTPLQTEKAKISKQFAALGFKGEVAKELAPAFFKGVADVDSINASVSQLQDAYLIIDNALTHSFFIEWCNASWTGSLLRKGEILGKIAVILHREGEEQLKKITGETPHKFNPALQKRILENLNSFLVIQQQSQAA